MVDLDSKRLETFLKFGIGLVLLILVNVLAGFWFVRWDLTQDKRYTIRQPTIELLRSVDQEIIFEVYLQGDIPAEFKRLRRAIKETLNEFRNYGGDLIQFRFIDPDLAESERSRSEFYQFLGESGIQPTNAIKTQDGKKTEKLIFPGAIVSYGGQQTGVMLFKGNRASPYLERINQSVEGVEYELASAIRKLIKPDLRRIAVIKGHGELDSLEIASLTNTLLEDYQVSNVDLAFRTSLISFDVALILKPTTPFTPLDIYKIDQFIMGGGKVAFFLNALRVNMDSAGGEGHYAFPYQTGLEKALFNYGIRLNKDLILDLHSGTYPVVAGYSGDQPQIRFLPWPFHPILNYFGDHPIVRNMDAISGRFLGTMDTVKARGITKTPLLFTSRYSRRISSPVKIGFNDFREPPDPAAFQEGPYPVAYLLEGSFTSAFKNRILPEGRGESEFRDQGVPSKILVCSDGDLLRNEINVDNGRPLQLGFEQFSKETFGNEDFIRNVMAFLIDEQGIINSRVKEVTIRPLDRIKVEREKKFWQMLNLGLPIVVLFLLGIAKRYHRKAKYTRF